MSIVKTNPKAGYTKILNDDVSDISNNAMIVYFRFMELHPDFNPTNERMQIKCNMGAVRYKAAKKELIENELLYVQRMGGKGANIIYYIGSIAVNKILVKKGKKIF